MIGFEKGVLRSCFLEQLFRKTWGGWFRLGLPTATKATGFYLRLASAQMARERAQLRGDAR
jgi:hypothetical protein